MIIEQRGAVTTIRVDGLKSGWRQDILLMSDLHFDSVQCNRELLAEHLAEAAKRHAWIMIFGDLFDAMQGRFDPRRSMDELRPEYRRDDYYDFVVADAARYFAPYKKQLVVIADGNHELAVLKNANTNLADRLVSNLRAAGSQVIHGGYGGWVVLLLTESQEGAKKSFRIKYNHGSGGEAPVTRGVIQTNRQAVYLPDADMVVNGHSHNEYIVPISRERCNSAGRLFFDVVYYIRTPGYKQGYADGSGGWEVTRGGVPKPIGSVWCRLEYRAGVNPCTGSHDGQILVTPIQDIRAPSVIAPVGTAYNGPTYDEDDARQA